MRTRTIHLINPKTNSFTTRPSYMNRALYSPLAGLLAVAACIPQDQYEVILTDENIEEIDFDAKVDMVGISAMTSYVNRGYEIADEFRRRGIPVIMGGVHPSFMREEDPFNLTQQPAASVPCGFTTSGAPIGMQIVAGKYADALVLRAARAFESVNPFVMPERPLPPG